jgi:hypothetical protein
MDARVGGFTLRADCPSCGLPVPLNAPSERAHCHSCLKDFAVPGAVFGELLVQFDDHHPKVVSPFRKGAQAEIGGVQMHAARVEGDAAEGATWFPAPEWLRALVPTAQSFTVTDPSAAPGAEQKTEAEAKDAGKPVALPCTQCGAPLHVTSESERTVTCEFCKTDVYLPDDLWRRLHPVKTMSPWFVRFEGKTRAELAAEDLERVKREADAQDAAAKARAADEAARMEAAKEFEGKKERAGCLRFLLVLGAVGGIGFAVWLSSRRGNDAAMSKAQAAVEAARADPEAVARVPLALTSHELAAKLGGRFESFYLDDGRDVPPSGWDYPDHRCTATVCVEVRSDTYARVDVYYRDKNADHPSAFSIAMRKPHGMDLTDDARKRISALLPGGMDSWGHWYAFGDRDILLDEHAGARVRVVADDDKNPEWRTQFDAEWKLVMGEVFKVAIAPSADELKALVKPPAKK